MFLAGPEVQWHDCLSIFAKQCVPQRPRERFEDNNILTAVDEAARRMLAYETDPPRHLEQDRNTTIEKDMKYPQPRQRGTCQVPTRSSHDKVYDANHGCFTHSL